MTPEKAQEIRRRYFRREATQRELAEEYRLARSAFRRQHENFKALVAKGQVTK